MIPEDDRNEIDPWSAYVETPPGGRATTGEFTRRLQHFDKGAVPAMSPGSKYVGFASPRETYLAVRELFSQWSQAVPVKIDGGWRLDCDMDAKLLQPAPLTEKRYRMLQRRATAAIRANDEHKAMEFDREMGQCANPPFIKAAAELLGGLTFDAGLSMQQANDPDKLTISLHMHGPDEAGVAQIQHLFSDSRSQDARTFRAEMRMTCSPYASASRSRH